jgi:predicted lipid-binding transport protein (Tim44 family)
MNAGRIKMLRRSRIRLVLCGLAAVALLAAAVGDADAARRSGGGFGSRGDRTYTPPAATQTAPNAAAPINRSITQPQAQRPGTVGQAAQPGGMFGGRMGGFMGGMMAGFLGAGLLGMLFGGGLLGGLSGLSGMLGLLLQVALVAIVARLAWSWWQRRQQQQAPAYAAATAAGPSMRDLNGYGNPPAQQPAYGGGSGSFLSGGQPGGNIEITEADFNAFEKRLADVQAAYSAEDVAGLRRLATPEVVSYFAEELTDNASRGVVNTVGDIKLLQGDLSEAWREGDTEYASVAMKYSSVDFTAERDSGKVVEGDKQPFERTEIWTFLRSRGGEWILSAVQQA